MVLICPLQLLLQHQPEHHPALLFPLPTNQSIIFRICLFQVVRTQAERIQILDQNAMQTVTVEVCIPTETLSQTSAVHVSFNLAVF